MRHLGILAGLLLFVAACGGNGDGGDELTLAEYFQRVEAASGDFARRGEDLLQTMEAAGANASSPADLRAPLLDFFDGSSLALADFTAAHRAIEPPAAAAEAHDNVVTALDELMETFEDARSGVASIAELEEVLERAGVYDAGERFDQACNALQALAASHDVDVDLECN